MIVISGSHAEERLRHLSGEPVTICYELPDYHMPSLLGLSNVNVWSVSLHTSFKAGTIIFAAQLIGIRSFQLWLQHGRAQTASLVTFQASRAFLRRSWTSPRLLLLVVSYWRYLFGSLGFATGRQLQLPSLL